MGLAIDIFIGLLIGISALVAVFLLSLYIRGAFRWRSLMHIDNAIAPTDPRFPLVIKSITGSLSTTGTITSFWGEPPDVQQARIEAIESAERSIHFETFMMTPGQRAQDFANAIARKASEGVQVQLLVDSFGSRTLPDKYWTRLRSAGVQVVLFNPFDWRAPANFAGRTHRKLLIIDGKRAMIGGAGISDLWDGSEKSDDTRPWFDMELALTGEGVAVLAAIFQTHWQGHRLQAHRNESGVTAIDMDAVYPSTKEKDSEEQNSKQQNSLSQDSKKESREEKSREEESREEESAESAAHILITASTKPSYRDSAIEILKQTLIASARHRVWLSSPYFLPNLSTRKLLIAAKQAGVDVRVLTTSVASDKKPVYYASYEVYGSLLEADIQIFEYQPSMLHAKMLIVDDSWANTGSANFDYRSFLHNDELDIVTDSPILFSNIEQMFEKGFANSDQIGLKQWQRRSWLKHRILGNAVRLMQWQL